MTVKLGLQLWNQVFSWEKSRKAAKRAEELGYDSLWTWEHALACMGETGLATAE
jgi:alkanesulfonate monooxygenase SsuD/methylene tetrahydromethanopterin reductase-like flavin-dependent oxidoreductase (luciferase family)